MALADLLPDPEPLRDPRLKADEGVPGFDRKTKDPLMRIPLAGRFSSDEDLCDPVLLVKFIKAHPEVLRLIEEGLGVRPDPLDPYYVAFPAKLKAAQAEKDKPPKDKPANRPPLEGSWPLAFLAYVASTTTSMQKWVHANKSSRELWRACGFKGPKPPSYGTIRRHFIALEDFIAGDEDTDETFLPDGFTRAKQYLVRLAREFEPQIGAAVHFDGTAVSTHAALVHCCPANTACGKKQIKRAQNSTSDRVRRPAALTHGTRVQTATVSEINAERHKAAREGDVDPDTDESEEQVKDGLDRLTDQEIKSLGLDESMGWWRKPNEKGVVHYYCCRDKSAAPRTYRRPGGANKFWIGWLTHKAADAMAGLSIDTDTQRADLNEHIAYPGALEKVRDTLGRWPQVMTADRGLGHKAVYEYNTARGIGSALPFKAVFEQKHRHQLEDHVVDRHGIPRCQHCGAPGKTTGPGRGFEITRNNTPTVRFSCIAKNTPQCKGIQTVNCSYEPRLLQPLRIDDQIYHQLRHRHNNREHVHLHERQRRGIGGRDVANRDHRIGIKWQRLRASAGIMLDWLCLCLRHGWLSGREATNTYDDLESATTGKRLRSVLAARERYQLNLPYGPAAASRGYGYLDPPWITHPPPKRGK